MNMTNERGVPQTMVDALNSAQLSYGGNLGNTWRSVTALVGPERKATLNARHWEHLSHDAMDNLYILDGSVTHLMLELGSKAPLKEIRFFAEVKGKIISGQIDEFWPETGHLRDWKKSSVWTFKDGVKPEYIAQSNILAWLIRQCRELVLDIDGNGNETIWGLPCKNSDDWDKFIGDTHNGRQLIPGRLFHVMGVRLPRRLPPYTVQRADVVAWYRDWSKGKAKRKECPEDGVEVFPVDLWSDDVVLDYIETRVAKHRAAEIELPQCTPEQRWATPDKWAVKKKNSKRATKLHNDKADAERHAATDKDFEVVFRPGKSARCEDYCDVVDFCTQHTAEEANGIS